MNYLLIFIFGLIIGSFLNVLICRMPDIKSIIATRSHCPHCKTKLAWYDLIPLLSFIMLVQKCRYCGKQISWQYPIVELATGLMFIILYYNFGLSWMLVLHCYLAMLLIAIFVYDLSHQIILDELYYPTLVGALIYLIFTPHLDYLNKIEGALIGLGIIAFIYFVTKGKGIGFADIKLAALLGLFIGWPYILVNLFFAFVIGAIIGIFLIFSKSKTWKSAIAFGPFLIIGFYITLFWGERILGWYLGI